jgi:ACS family hexuronate transporter-like MFS transporter
MKLSNVTISEDLQKGKLPRPAGRLRWWIAGTLLCSTTINYISRQTFSVLSPVITAHFHLNHVELARILGAFQVAYALAWLAGGIFLDAVGTRLGLALAVVFWSAVNIVTSFANSAAAFVILRFALGIGEGINWPGASKAVAEWFPDEERSVAVAIFDSGSSVGATIAILFIPWIGLIFGWRWSFVFSGLLGFAWLFLWLRVYHPLDRHPAVTAEEARFIRSGQRAAQKVGGPVSERWKNLAKDRNVWGIVLGRALTDPIWWFYVFWLPQYLSDARGFSLRKIALFAWMPFVAADLGNFTGGLVSGFCIRHGVPLIRARRWVCVASCLPMLLGIPVARVQSPYVALVLISVALWGFASWSTMGLTLPSDLFPQDVVATVTGLSGLAAGLAGAGLTFLVGFLVDRFSYAPAFLLAGLLPLFATVFLFVLIRVPQGSPDTGGGA